LTSETSRKPSDVRPCLTVSPWGSLTTGLGVTITRAIMAGDLGERFGAQVVQMLGAAEHRSERTPSGVPAPWLRGGDEERKPAGVPMPKAWGQWAAWAPKIRRGPPAGIARSGFVPRLAREEGLAHEALVGGEVAQAGLRDDVLWKLWRVGLLIPARTAQPVAHELLVIGIGRGADLVCRHIQLAGAVRGEYLVDEDDLVSDLAELEIDALGLAHDHEPAREFLSKVLQHGGQVGDHPRDQVVGLEGVGLREPEYGQLGKDLAAVGNAVRQHMVKRPDSVGGDHQQLVLAELVSVANLATGEELERQLGVRQRGSGDHVADTPRPRRSNA